jgi:hypothetical protein
MSKETIRTDRLILVGVIVLLAGLIAWLIAELPSWFFHPLGVCSGSGSELVRCKSYGFWSGIGSDIGEATIVTGLVTIVLGFWHHHNCQVHGCLRLSFRPHPAHGYPVCRGHHPHRVMPDGTVIDKTTGEPVSTRHRLDDVEESLASLHRKHDELAKAAQKTDGDAIPAGP